MAVELHLPEVALAAVEVVVVVRLPEATLHRPPPKGHRLNSKMTPRRDERAVLLGRDTLCSKTCVLPSLSSRTCACRVSPQAAEVPDPVGH